MDSQKQPAGVRERSRSPYAADEPSCTGSTSVIATVFRMNERPTARKLGELGSEDRDRIVQAIQEEAQAAGWHRMNGHSKARLYRQWEEEHRLSHAAVKDGIMKGFDAAQHIPPSGEAALHVELRAALEASPIPYVRSKVRRPEWRREVDFVLGFTARFLTHIAELEPAPSWQTGLQQALLYKSLYYQATRVQALPTLVIFGDVTGRRWEQISTVCVDQRVLLLPYRLAIDDEPASEDIVELLQTSQLALPFESSEPPW
jgi:hypothetical protein